MGRYDGWEANQLARLDKLKQHPLFTDCLLPDIEAGEVFPAIRKAKIDFYHLGRKLFSFDGRGFRSNIVYLVAYQDKPNGEITESGFKDLKLCESFYDGYSQIKMNTKLYVQPESRQVSMLWNKHSACRSGAGPFVVLDIELSLYAQDDDRTADRIDLILFDTNARQIRFFEAKTFQNKELQPVHGHVAVVDQIGRYTRQITSRHVSLLDDYSQYVRLLNNLCGISIPTPTSIDNGVDLLVFDYNAEQEKILIAKVIPAFGGQFHCHKIGQASGTSQGTLKSWWRFGRK